MSSWLISQTAQTMPVGDVGRIFGLDIQLLVDACITAIAIFVLFVALSYLVFNPAREFLEKRRMKIREEMEKAEIANEEAADLKSEYTIKLSNVDKEVEEILSNSRKKALKQEKEMLEGAKAEAVRIVERANKEVELEKNKVRDEMKQEMISVASLMAGKFVSASMDEAAQEQLIEETLKEMGDGTWQS